MSFILNRGINQITSEQALGGPKDSFNEDISCNLMLIKSRIKKDLAIRTFFVGKYTSTNISVLSIDGICKKELVDAISNKISTIHIDGIIDSSYLNHYLLNQHSFFPIIISTERPDKTCMALLEGKVVVLVDGSPYALVLPNFFFDFFHTTDDYYQKNLHTSFIRFIRFLAFIIAIFTPAFYLSVSTRDYQLIPISLLLTLKAGRSFVPFPAYIEAILMMISFEILKESDLRKSTISNSSISILGGLILGDAAVAAGIVSPIMIIVIAISSISSLIFQSNELTNTIRFYQLLLFLLSVLFGIYGVLLGTAFLLYSLFTTSSFGFSYIGIDWSDALFRFHPKILKRNPKLNTNQIRGRL